MKLAFTKMHGIGNDFIVVDCITAPQLHDISLVTWSGYARRLCDRRFGIGADQMLLILPSEISDVCMRIFNPDGVEVQMCGNGIRCVAVYAWDKGIAGGDKINVETPAGNKTIQKINEMVRVDMETPQLSGREIPVNADGRIVDYPVDIGDKKIEVTCVSMGNPHAVVFVSDVNSYPVDIEGPMLETNEFFPERTNVEFVQIIDRGQIRMRVWERGAGETLACGTGACAAVVAAYMKGYVDKFVTVALRGGCLDIEWADDGSVYMTGPAAYVFTGTVEI
ncbi:MAG: diaminopimelate epimerase [Candidatus Magnetominusculus sp. LBB02]|nr:diaminopimelate epimerase [Candidatus Magnetominusculus sp. LBB02]